MTDGPDMHLLYAIVRRESRSLMQYLREVPPWTGIRDENALSRLRHMANEELELSELLGRWLQKNAARPVHLGAYPDFTPYNDQALHFLLPKVIREQRQLLADLERDQPLVAVPAPDELLTQLLQLKRNHVAELETLDTGPHSVTAVC